MALTHGPRLLALARLTVHSRLMHRCFRRLGLRLLLLGSGLVDLLLSSLHESCATLLKGSVDGLGDVYVGVHLEGRIQVALYRVRTRAVVAHDNVIDAMHSLRAGRDSKRPGQIAAGLVGGPATLLINSPNAA